MLHVEKAASERVGSMVRQDDDRRLSVPPGDRAGKYRFRVKAGNGQVVATGEAYQTKAAAKAKKGCESVQRAADGAPVEEVES